MQHASAPNKIEGAQLQIGCIEDRTSDELHLQACAVCCLFALLLVCIVCLHRYCALVCTGVSLMQHMHARTHRLIYGTVHTSGVYTVVAHTAFIDQRMQHSM